MVQIEYLYENYWEPTPQWLMDIKEDSEIPWKEFFGSRNVFYPGAGADAHPVNCFGGGHSAHCFVYVDYLMLKEIIEIKAGECAFPTDLSAYDKVAREQIENRYFDIKMPLFPGYTLIYKRELEEIEFFAMFSDPYSYRRAPELQRFSNRSGFDRRRHFVKFYVFERNNGCKNKRAVERFALLYLGADAFPVFNTVYANGGANLFAMLIEDYGFGCQYEKFGGDGLLHGIARWANVAPELILGKPWDGYEPIGRQNPLYRMLYKRKG